MLMSERTISIYFTHIFFLVHFNCDYANKPSFSDAIVREEVEASEPELESELKEFGEEQKQMGKLSWTVYCSFWRAVGGGLAVAVLLSLFLMQGTNNRINMSCMYYKSIAAR